MKSKVVTILFKKFIKSTTATVLKKKYPANLMNFVLFDLLLYVHGKQLRSCRDGQLLNLFTTLFLGKPTSSLHVFSANSFVSN